MTLPMAIEDPDPIGALIASVQTRLRAYIFTLTGRREDVEDILQETNRVLWRKREMFEEGTHFWAWASKVAYFQVMAFRRRISRDRHVFGDDALHLMADECAEDRGVDVFQQERLKHCMEQLPERQREAVTLFYFREAETGEVGRTMKLKENAVSQLLFRARQNLKNCLAGEAPRPPADSLP